MSRAITGPTPPDRPIPSPRWLTTRPDDPLDAFRWHPEPELIGIRDAATSRAALERAGEATWRRASTGCTTRRWSARWARPPATPSCGASTSARPAARARRPRDPAPLDAVLAEFTTRIAPHTLNSYHPRALSYFTPPPLVASIVGEVLAQWTNQGIDVWHAGPVGAFVEEEVVRWLCDLVGYGEGAFGLLRVGRRDGELHRDGARARRPPAARSRGAPRPPRGAALEGVRVYTSDQTHFSIARALDELGFPPETLVVLPDRRRVPPPRRAGGRGDRRGPRRGPACRSPSAPSRARRTRAPWT